VLFTVEAFASFVGEPQPALDAQALSASLRSGIHV
jgi:hypothetical protein